jgi:hypothetical protein
VGSRKQVGCRIAGNTCFSPNELLALSGLRFCNSDSILFRASGAQTQQSSKVGFEFERAVTVDDKSADSYDYFAIPLTSR